MPRLNRVGGPTLWYSDGQWTAWQMADLNGVLINQWGTQNTWTTRCADLSWGGSTVGSQITTIGLLADVYTPAGTWDILYADMTITSQNGTVTPVFTSQSFTPTFTGVQGSNYTGTPTGYFESAPTASDGTVTAGAFHPATRFYLADHLGSAQMEFSSGGWPVSSSQFLPFGGEINPQPTTNHYKFTGKERDTESGLDYFGARYYGSNRDGSCRPILRGCIWPIQRIHSS